MTPRRAERRIVCAWFPHWPLESWRRAQGAKAAERPSSPSPALSRPEGGEPPPFVLLARTARGGVIHGADERARGFGIAPGQKATDVSAAHPDMRFVYADPIAEQRALERLAAWLR